MLNDLPRLKMMASKLMIEVQHGRVESEWECDFISDIYTRLSQMRPLTEKQTAKLEALFERL